MPVVNQKMLKISFDAQTFEINLRQKCANWENLNQKILTIPFGVQKWNVGSCAKEN